MSLIVYGVSGEGSGHTSRAMSVLPHLVEQGHDVRVVGYDRSYRDLKDRFDVFQTEGLTIGQVDNEVSVTKTITENLARIPRGHARSRELKEVLFKEFSPEAVITDFEPMTAYLANYFDIPLITLDNQHRMRYMELAVPERLVPGMALTKAIIRAMIPRPDVSLVTTFHFAPLTNDRTFSFPPLIRPTVQSAVPSRGDHIVVYFTKGADSFVGRLREYPRERFHVYGQGREGVEGNIEYKGFSREGFVNDLATCKAVMASAGFTLITEALNLKKPYLALPTKGQFEQELNAFMLDDQGYGKGVFRVTRETIGDFLYRLPEYTERLEEYQPSDGSGIRAKLDELLADGCALAREYHERRKG
ncbi:MAG: glycosyltransferase family protein [bacterium]|nr:glycosyltransferase family protein [bacterium]MDT8396479.1 glycosyltransferase family protein [bacterium]